MAYRFWRFHLPILGTLAALWIVFRPSTAIALAVATGVIGTAALARRLWAKLVHPKDFAFEACTRFGPELGLPKDQRIRKAFPRLQDEVVRAWVNDFERVEDEIERLARAGGPTRLGNKSVERSLRATFPFLVGRGLVHAHFLTWYEAHHEGWDVTPDES